MTATIVVVILYGSLYPFGFSNNPHAEGPIRSLWETRSFFPSAGNLIANFILYVPLGFFWVQASRKRLFSSVAIALCAGISLSTFIEFMQFYDAGRYSNMSDIYVNGAGTLFGAIAASLVRKIRTSAFHWIPRFDVAILLLLCWLGYRLFPYAPVINLHKYWDAIRPLFRSPGMSGADVFRHITTWFAVAVLLETVLGSVFTRLAIVPLLIVVVAARILIMDIVLSRAEVFGGLLGAVLWIFVLSRIRSRVIVVAVLFALLVVVQALSPFNFSQPPHSFGWIPFRSFVTGSEEKAVASFLEKTFIYGCLVWLFSQAGSSWLLATGLGVILVFASHWMQTYLPGRSAEITDVTLLLIVAAIMWLMPNAKAKEPQRI